MAEHRHMHVSKHDQPYERTAPLTSITAPYKSAHSLKSPPPGTVTVTGSRPLMATNASIPVLPTGGDPSTHEFEPNRRVNEISEVSLENQKGLPEMLITVGLESGTTVNAGTSDMNTKVNHKNTFSDSAKKQEKKNRR